VKDWVDIFGKRKGENGGGTSGGSFLKAKRTGQGSHRPRRSKRGEYIIYFSKERGQGEGAARELAGKQKTCRRGDSWTVGLKRGGGVFFYRKVGKRDLERGTEKK